MPPSTVRRLLAASAPLVTPLLALGFNLALVPLLKFESPFLAFTAVVLLSAWLGGARGGLLATVVSLIAATLFFQIGGGLQVSPAGHSLRRVYLPVSVGPVATTATSMAAAPGAASAPAQQRPALLVIDDEPEMRAVLVRVLERLGFCVYSSGDGPAGLALLAADGPQIAGIFLDLTTPGSSGPELARAIRQLRPALPIALMSGYAIEEIAARHSELRPRCFLQKPFTRAALDAALTILLGPETAV